MVLGGKKRFQYKCKIEDTYVFFKDSNFRNNHQ